MITVPEWYNASVVVDRNLVTSRKPEDLAAFCRESIRVLISGPAVSAGHCL